MGNAHFVRHIYEVEKCLKSYTVYRLEEGQSKILVDTIRIELFRRFSKAKDIKYYLRNRTTSSWRRSDLVSGLRGTERENVFEGNMVCNGVKSLILFQFTPDQQNLAIDVFPSSYPHHKGILKKIIQNHTYEH